jgi:glyceraldehyde-3-phosphate dehydrogenase/erythrose-4-phosphate dehydrogenase
MGSSRIVGSPHSSIDLPLVQVYAGTFISVAAWYDNELGFANRLAEVAQRLQWVRTPENSIVWIYTSFVRPDGF